MATVRDILADKGTGVYTVEPTATVMEAVERMNHHRIGALVVMDGDRVAGMFTERDVLQRVVGVDRRPHDMLVMEVMTADVVCCRPDDDLDEVAKMMTDRRIRHLPVCRGGLMLQGLISIGDLNAHFATQQMAQISQLNDYVYGRV